MLNALEIKQWLPIGWRQRVLLLLTLAFVIAAFSMFVTPRKVNAEVAGQTLESCRDWTRWTSTYFQIGDRGGCVWTIQYFLNQWRYLNRLPAIRYDGIYGPETKSAVFGFQWVHGLQMDGLAGWKTLDKMNNVCFSWVHPPFYLSSHACITLR